LHANAERRTSQTGHLIISWVLLGGNGKEGKEGENVLQELVSWDGKRLND
jgi:hypothetical protein